MRYRFLDFEIDYQLYELRRDGERVRIDRKVFDLLRYLIDRRDRVVGKAELLREVWAGETVVDAVVPTAIARLRKALGQRGAESAPIETAHGRGYRFVAHLSSLPPRHDGPHAGDSRPEELDTDLHPGLRDPFVGRDSIMQRLSGALHKVLGGQSRIRVLAGEPGIGKTRAAQEFAQRARDAGASVWAGRAHESVRDPLWPWAQILRPAVGPEAQETLRLLPAAVRRRLGAILPEIQSASVGSPPPEPEPSSVQAFDSVAQLLRAAAEHKPRLLLLDDLHWADDASLELLAYLTEELGEARVMVLATFRDVELPPGHPHATLLDRLERARSFKRIDVPALDPPDVSRYVYEFTGQKVAPELAARIHERTAGNAFFVRETVRSLTWSALRDGHLDLSAVVLPESARDVVRRRLASLPSHLRPVLDAAATIGEHFDLPLLQRAVDVEPEQLLEALDRAEAARLLVRSDAGTTGNYAFAHALLQETIYGDLPSTQRCELHHRIAEALEAEHDVRPNATIDVAYHFHQALPYADGQKVFEHGVRAAEHAARHDDPAQAATWYHNAYDGLRYAHNADPERSAEVILAEGRALRDSGRPKQARAAFDRVVELSEHGKASSRWVEAALRELDELK